MAGCGDRAAGEACGTVDAANKAEKLARRNRCGFKRFQAPCCALDRCGKKPNNHTIHLTCNRVFILN